jgi:hypothetical protein
MAANTWTLTLGNGGWVRVELDRHRLYIRMGDDAGRLVPHEMFVEGGRLDATLLRRIPLGVIEAAVNTADNAMWIRGRMNVPSPDPATALTFFTEPLSFRYDKERKDRVPTVPHWAAAMLWSQVDEGVAPKPKPPLMKQSATATVRPAPPDPRLEVPDAKPYGDDFYRRVALVYSGLVAAGEAPAPRIADANGVPAITTVHRWVREARRRGFLPPATRGKAG